MSFFLRIFYKLDKEIRLLFGFNFRLRTADRKVLDKKIIPLFSNNLSIKRVLFVGCDVYTTHYSELFKHCDYYTIEPTKEKAKYGSQKHTVGFLQDLKRYFPPAFFDLIICNGVYGWGLDEQSEIEQAFGACYECLQPNGFLLLGWNDLKEHNPISLAEVEALKLFCVEDFPLHGTNKWEIGNNHRHVYELFRKVV
jgi:hypothetical protein